MKRGAAAQPLHLTARQSVAFVSAFSQKQASAKSQLRANRAAFEQRGSRL